MKLYFTGAALIRLMAAVAIALAAPLAAGQQRCGEENDPYTGVITLLRKSPGGGGLRVKLSRRENAFDAHEGMPVRRGAVLELADGAHAKIVCGDKVEHTLRAGRNPVPCSTNSFVNRKGTCIPRTRGGDSLDGTFPLILSPRRTLLLSRRPTFRWAPVTRTVAAPGALNPAVTYTVSIFSEGMVPVWSEKTTATSLEYPSARPELKAGEYFWKVEADGLSSSEDERVPNTGFMVLDDCKAPASCPAQDVRVELEAVRALKLPADTEKLLVAYVYKDRELHAEAIEMVNSMTDAAKGPPVIRLLGDLYALTGLNREAERTYLRALTQPQMAEDPEDKALTLSALAETYEALGSPSNARARWDEAIRVYEALGDREMAAQLKQRRDRLHKTR
jgi:hypothetical protein